MDAFDLTDEASESATVADEPAISALQTSPDRTIFTEDSNDEGWISTDFTVALRR